MPEDDPNGNCDFVEYDSWPRWGPNHKGAQELQRLYTKGILNYFFFFYYYFIRKSFYLNFKNDLNYYFVIDFYVNH
jgi:hypothetical protein